MLSEGAGVKRGLPAKPASQLTSCGEVHVFVCACECVHVSVCMCVWCVHVCGMHVSVCVWSVRVSVCMCMRACVSVCMVCVVCTEEAKLGDLTSEN